MDQADLVTTPTETAASYLRSAGLRAPVRAIPSGVDLARFYPRPGIDRDAIKARYGLRAKLVALLYVGRIDRDKSLDVAVRAMSSLDRPDVQLGIAGRGRQALALARLAAELGVSDRITFTGFVPAADLPSLLNGVDVFVMPSEVELQSTATLEAMSTDRLMLLANAGALPELVTDGKNGRLFAPGDAEDLARKMAALAADRGRLRALGEVSRERALLHRVLDAVEEYSRA